MNRKEFLREVRSIVKRHGATPSVTLAALNAISRARVAENREIRAAFPSNQQLEMETVKTDSGDTIVTLRGPAPMSAEIRKPKL